jgi:hypothetical protein
MSRPRARSAGAGAGTRLTARQRVAGHETAERRRRLALTRRGLARASGIEPTRLGSHEEGRIALDPAELHAIDGVLSPREMERGLPSVRLEYVAAAGASAERDEQIRGDLLRILFENGCTRSWAESLPAGHKKGAGRTNPTPTSDLPNPDQEVCACLFPL